MPLCKVSVHVFLPGVLKNGAVSGIIILTIRSESDDIMVKKVYKHLDKLPKGRASDKLTNGCLVLEGGGWKGLYTVGVLDCLMMNDINFTSVVGCLFASSAMPCRMRFTTLFSCLARNFSACLL